MEILDLTFDEAVSKLREVVKELEGVEEEPQWVFREDLIELWPRTYIKLPLRDNKELVKQLYEFAVKQKIGIELGIHCFFDGKPIAYAYVPKDELDADYRMLHDLKISINQKPDHCVVIPVKSRVRWKCLKLIEPYLKSSRSLEGHLHLRSSCLENNFSS